MFSAPIPDQRRSERRWLTIPVQIHMGAALIEGTSLNLSDHGMYLFTAAHIPLGSNIEIVFRPPEEKKLVRVPAVVRRKVVYLYGIEFTNSETQPNEHAADRAEMEGNSGARSSPTPEDRLFLLRRG